MILIPEIETIAILTPRTGSGSAYRAIMDAYPDAIKLYRHMEADGVPQGYDRWEKVGVVFTCFGVWLMYMAWAEYGVLVAWFESQVAFY